MFKNFNMTEKIHKFYLLDTPRNALLFAMLWGAFSAFLVWYLIFTCPEFAGLGGVLWVLLFGIIAGIHWYIVYVLAVYGLLQGICHKRLAGILTAVAAVFLPTYPLMLLFYNLKKRQITAAIFSALTILAHIVWVNMVIDLDSTGKSIFSTGNKYVYIVTIAAWLLPLLALLFTGDGKKLSWKIIYPVLSAAIIYIISIQYNAIIETHCYSVRYEIGYRVGYSIRLEDFLADNEKAQSIADTPLKGMLSLKEFYISEPLPENYIAAVKLAENNRDFMLAVESLDSLELFDIKMEIPEKGGIFSASMQYLNSVRCTARYMAAAVRVRTDDLEQVRLYNARLIKLRDLLLYDRSNLISRLVGLAVEGIRIDALGCVAARHELTQVQWLDLLGNIPDWDRISCEFLADETVAIQEIMEKIYRLSELDDYRFLPTFDKKNPLVKILTPPVNGHFLRDYHASLCCIRDMVNMIKAGNADPVSLKSLIERSEKQWHKKMYIFSAMLLPAMDEAYLKGDAMKCQQNMVLAAAGIMKFYRLNGRLPDDLAEAGISGIKNVYGDSMRYIAGDLPMESSLETRGFALYFPRRDAQGGIAGNNYPGGINFKVLLEPVKKLPPQPTQTDEAQDEDSGMWSLKIEPYQVEFSVQQ